MWRTHDPALDRAVKPLLEPSSPIAKQPVNVRVTAGEGAPLVSEWSLVKHPETQVTVISDAELRPAQNRGLSIETLRDQFGRLGNTPYELAAVVLEASGAVFVPASLLNQLRREAVERLQALQAELRPMAIADPVASMRIERTLPNPTTVPDALQRPAELHLLVRTPEQMEAALELHPASITLDYLDLYGLRPSIERVKASGIVARVASPRVLKPGEARIVNFLLSLDCAIVVRSTGLLQTLRDKEHAALIGDFSLNAANSVTARVLQEMGIGQLTPTHDLNAAQVAELARDVGGETIEAIAYQHLPVFHTEHCVFCRFPSRPERVIKTAGVRVSSIAWR